MRILRTIVLLLLLSPALGAEVPPVATAPVAAKEKSESTIWVKVEGDGFQHKGSFRVARGSTLLALVLEAVPSRISNGRFQVTRIADGYERNFGFRSAKDKEKPLPDFELLDGDFVYGLINLP